MALINLLYESLGDTVMDESIIITFANQKGGVGKTTLCVTFANYLVKKGLPVIVIDCDSQESLAQRRESDLKRYASDEITIPYEVLPFSLNKEEALFNFIGNVRKTRCVAIFLPATSSNKALLRYLPIPTISYVPTITTGLPSLQPPHS